MMMPAILLALICQAELGPWDGIPEQDALSYALVVEPDLQKKTLLVECRYLFRAVEPLDKILLDHPGSPQWSVAFFDDEGQAMSVEREGGRLALLLSPPLSAGQEISFVGKFSGKPPGGFLFRKSRSGKTVAFTDHFSVRAREWLPCEDHPSDRARFEIEVRAPDGMEIIASGVLDAEGRTFRTVADIQTYLFAIGIGPWVPLQEKGDERFVPHLVYPQDVPRARPALQFHSSWMQTMEAVFGPYLYGKFCVVQIPTRWGGMENAGNVWLNERIFDGRGRGVGTLAHEFVHQWFGDAVGFGVWQDAWLSEGFASYFGPWLHEQEGGGSPLQRTMNGARRSWLRSSSGKTRPIRWDGFADPDELFGSSAPNTYQKGAWVLHMLRGEMGDEAFFAGLSTWYREFSGRPAATADLQAVMSKAVGRDLAWFFQQWLDRPGCPELSLKWDKTGADLRQVSGGALWRFPLKVAWVNADGEKEQKVFAIVKVAERLELGPGFRTPVLDPAVELLFRSAQ